jgi:hypothetical protein
MHSKLSHTLMRTQSIAIVFITSAALAVGTANGQVIVHPEPAPGPLDNPLKGWCPYTNAGPILEPYSMVFLYAPWRELEPEEGRFEFEKWERNAWSVPEAKGKHVVLRIYIDYPSRSSGLPDWLKGQVKLTSYNDHGGGLSPDYDNPRMVAAMERLIAAMGERYNKHGRVAFLQLGLLGFWGEWHTWPREALYASPATERRIIDACRRAFPDKILMARYARDYTAAQEWLGFHDDLLPEDTDNGKDWSFLNGFRRSGRESNWKQAIIGGEMVPHQAKKWLGPRFEDTLRMVERAHFSWVGPYCPALERSRSPEFLKASQSLVRRMGYQFRLTEIRHSAEIPSGGELSVAITGSNDGVAPFYYSWPVELALIDTSGKIADRIPLGCDIRTWQPGSFAFSSKFAVKAKPGRYQLALGFIDPWTGRPAIRLANNLLAQEGWTVLSSVAVVPAR